MNDIDKYIEDLEQLFETSKENPFTKKLAVDREEFNNILIEIRGAIPKEIEEAKKIVEKCEEYIEDAKSSADSIIKQAEIEASKLVSEHEVYLLAVEEAKNIREVAEDNANDGVLEAIKFVDGILGESEEMIAECRNKINEEQMKIDEILNKSLELIYEVREGFRKD